MMRNRCCGQQMDCGPNPAVVNIECLTERNHNYRTALWTGEHLQVTLMCIPPGGEIGVEMHPETDQFLRIESGCGVVMMGKCRGAWECRQHVLSGSAVMIPAGTWHNVVNTGKTPLKLYSIYAPPHHPFGTVHATRQAAQAAEAHD